MGHTLYFHTQKFIHEEQAEYEICSSFLSIFMCEAVSGDFSQCRPQTRDVTNRTFTHATVYNGTELPHYFQHDPYMIEYLGKGC